MLSTPERGVFCWEHWRAIAVSTRGGPFSIGTAVFFDKEDLFKKRLEDCGELGQHSLNAEDQAFGASCWLPTVGKRNFAKPNTVKMGWMDQQLIASISFLPGLNLSAGSGSSLCWRPRARIIRLPRYADLTGARCRRRLLVVFR